MRKFFYSAPIVSLILAAAIIVTLSLWFSANSLPEFAKTNEHLSLQTPAPEKSQIAEVKPVDVAILRNYAESYEPKSTKAQVIPAPPIPNEKVLQIISHLADTQSREHEKYIVLIFLRLYRFHIEHFKQGYELGRDNRLTKEFFRLIGYVNYRQAEIITADEAYTYAAKKSELRKYPLVEKEIIRIKKAEEKIRKESGPTLLSGIEFARACSVAEVVDYQLLQLTSS